MTTTITLKNVPDALHGRLRAAAAAHRRSINSEAIVCLEAALSGQQVSVDDRLARARLLRATLNDGRFAADEIDALKRDGRP